MHDCVIVWLADTPLVALSVVINTSTKHLQLKTELLELMGGRTVTDYKKQ